MLDRQDRKIGENVSVLYIKNDKFKTSRLSFTMYVPLESEKAALNAVLISLIEMCCAKYPEFSLFNKYLEELYGVSVCSHVNKLGETQVLTLSAVCINDDMSFDDSKLTLNTAKLLSDLIFDPCFEGGEFREKDVNQAKRQVKETIKSEFNEKRAYARRRCEELMCKGERFEINKFGKQEDVEKITSSDLKNAWEEILSSAKIEITALGSYDIDSVYDIFSEKFSRIERNKLFEFGSLVKEEVSEVREYEDSLDVSQCKLVMGFRMFRIKSIDDLFSARLMVSFLGAAPNSKLFVNVREALSLCYYCSANFNKEKRIMFIESGVEKKNLEKTKREILRQIERIQGGDFFDSELDATKAYLSQTFEEIEDSLGSIDRWYISQALSEKTFTPLQYAENIKKVTREQIIESAKNVKLDTVYTLVGRGG